jgi:hypothetical protein
MKQTIIAAVGVALAVAASGCVAPRAPVVPPTAFVYTQVKAPLQTDLEGADMQAERMGESTARFLYIPFTWGLASFAWGDASTEQAAKDGGIDEVQFADYEFLSVLGVYAQTTIRAHGKATPQ